MSLETISSPRLRVQQTQGIFKLQTITVTYSYLHNNTMYIFLLSLKGLSVYALLVFKVFQSFSLPYTIINFLFASLKLLVIFGNAFLWLADVLYSRPLIGCRENAQELTCHRRLLVFCKHFQCQNDLFKGTQDWEFFWLRFWNLYFFVVSYVKILRF